MWGTRRPDIALLSLRISQLQREELKYKKGIAERDGKKQGNQTC